MIVNPPYDTSLEYNDPTCEDTVDNEHLNRKKSKKRPPPISRPVFR